MEHWLDMWQKHPDRMDEKEIFCAAISNIAAGSDTINATIQAFFYHLLKNPRHLARLRQEIDAAHARGELSHYVTYAEAQTLPFLQACVSVLPLSTGMTQLQLLTCADRLLSSD